MTTTTTTITDRALKLATEIRADIIGFRRENEDHLDSASKFHLDYIMCKVVTASGKVFEADRAGKAEDAEGYFSVIEQMQRAANAQFAE